MKNLKEQKSGMNKLGISRRKSVQMSAESLVKMAPLNPEWEIPLMVQPAIDGVDLVAWANNNHDLVENLLAKHRAILFRDFQVETEARFHELVQATSDGNLLDYRDRSSPRHEVSDKIYTSTDYPADQSIFLHNEGTYWLTWPLQIYFFCFTAPGQGGATPIADCVRIFNRISPEIRERFSEKQVLYVRNYNDGFGLTWQTVYQTTDKAEVEAYCRKNKIEFEWKPGDRLRTRQLRPAIAQHPRTGKMIWFNHAAFFHISSLDPALREGLLAELAEEELPYNTYYGDGTPIEPSVLDEIRHAYQEEKRAFPWQKGDILFLDNMSICHGREPYAGSRKILVAMTNPYGRKND